jgi:hypothetical protein
MLRALSTASKENHFLLSFVERTAVFNSGMWESCCLIVFLFDVDLIYSVLSQFQMIFDIDRFCFLFFSWAELSEWVLGWLRWQRW